MEDKIKQYLRVKHKTHVESIHRIREIHQDMLAGKLSLQEAKVCIDEEEESVANQLQAIRDFLEMTEEDMRSLDG